MTKYSFAGSQVDVKATNLHGSALADSTLSTNYNGVTTEIPVGSVVIAGTDAGSIDVPTGDTTAALGVVLETRTAGDSRPVAYTYFGWVRVRTDNSAILAGSPIKAAATGEVALADPAGTAADIPRVIGKALEANGSVDGTIIQALVWFG